MTLTRINKALKDAIKGATPAQAEAITAAAKWSLRRMLKNGSDTDQNSIEFCITKKGNFRNWTSINSMIEKGLIEYRFATYESQDHNNYFLISAFGKTGSKIRKEIEAEMAEYKENYINSKRETK